MLCTLFGLNDQLNWKPKSRLNFKCLEFKILAVLVHGTRIAENCRNSEDKFPPNKWSNECPQSQNMYKIYIAE